MFLSEKVFRLKNIFVIAMKTVSSRASSPFVQNVLRLFDASLRGALSASSSHLYVHLLALQNRRGWCEWLCVSDRVLAVSCGMTARTVGRCRDELVGAGLVRCRQEGAGNRRQWLYRLAAWRDDAVCAAACDELALLNDSGDTFLNEKDIRKREEREERVSLDEMLRLMRGNEVWRRSFCESNGLSEAELDGLLVLFARKLGNSGVVEKEVSDAYCHFGHWYNRQALQQMRQETERLARASELSAQRDEQLRQEELEKARREEESRQAWLRVKAEMQQQAAAGDPHALRVMEQFRDVIESDAGLPAARKEGGV